MAILKNLEHVDERFLKQLVTDKQLYQEADVGVKRQIWLYHQSLFGEELGPLFEQYIAVSAVVSVTTSSRREISNHSRNREGIQR